MTDPRSTRADDARRAFVAATRLEHATRERLERRLGHAIHQPTRRIGARPLWLAPPVLALLALVLLSPTDPGVPAVSGLLSEHVALQLDGEGTVGGTEQAPVIHWRQGTVSVSVVPDQGVALSVVTEEATVEVVGTVFDVSRAHHATEVVVSEGIVAVTCAGGSVARVEAGQAHACLPATLAPLLLRVVGLAEAGASPAARLESLDRADALAEPGSAAADELLAHRAKALADAGRPDEALAVAGAYLSRPSPPRRDELLAFVARTSFERAGCSAVPSLEAAVEALPPGPEALMLASCLLHDDPERAAALIEAAAPGATGRWVTVAQRLREALGASP